MECKKFSRNHAWRRICEFKIL